MSSDRVTVETVRRWRSGGKGALIALTAYDYTFGRLLDEAGVDILHVGDTLGMIQLGHEDTTAVTMADMLAATRAVVRARQRALVTADLPARSYDMPDDAVANARALVEAGADAVKMEGGREILPQVRAVLAAGIAVQGHLGMLPQHVKEEGGYKKKGKTEVEARCIREDAVLFEREGVFSIVLEGVVSAVAEEATRAISIPTIGIASGNGTTGQIRVLTDVLGLTPWFNFPFVVREAELARGVDGACRAYRARCGGK